MIDIALLLIANEFLTEELGKSPPKSFVEQPPISKIGYLTFAEWEKKFGGSYLDYIDWVEGN